jgi:hypothetical protein
MALKHLEKVTSMSDGLSDIKDVIENAPCNRPLRDIPEYVNFAKPMGLNCLKVCILNNANFSDATVNFLRASSILATYVTVCP